MRTTLFGYIPMNDEKLEKILFVDDEESILDIACAFFNARAMRL